MKKQNTISLLLIQIAIILISVATIINTFKISKLKEEIISLNYSYNESNKSNYDSSNR